MVRVRAGDDDAGCRLDRMIRRLLPLKSLADIYSLIRKGKIRSGGKKLQPGYRLSAGEEIAIEVDESEIASPGKNPDRKVRDLVRTTFFQKNFKIIFEDKDLLACGKPPGLAVHPGTGHLRGDTLVELAHSYLLSKAGDVAVEPLLVHRLDRDTSGVILLAKNRRILRAIHGQMREGNIGKEYVAVCHHRPRSDEGTIRLMLERNHEQKTGTKMRVGEEGLYSETSFRIEEYRNDLSRLELSLKTGRTHQIRVHLAHEGAPVVGDARYGDSVLDAALFDRTGLPERLYLHARKLTFRHPDTGKKVSLQAPVPSEFYRILDSA